MAAAVATPLERQFSTIPGLDSMTSVSSRGSTSRYPAIRVERELDGAAMDVQAAIVAAQRLLPNGMPSPPTFRKVNPADMPVLMMCLNSPTLPLFGGGRIRRDHDRPAHFHDRRRGAGVRLRRAEIRGAGAARSQPPGGPWNRHRRSGERAHGAQREHAHRHALGPAGRRSPCRPPGSSANAAEYRPLIVTYRNGSPVRLGELGQVIDSVENDKTAAWYGTARLHQPHDTAPAGHQHGEVVDRINSSCPEFRSQMPPRSIWTPSTTGRNPSANRWTM